MTKPKGKKDNLHYNEKTVSMMLNNLAYKVFISSHVYIVTNSEELAKSFEKPVELVKLDPNELLKYVS